MLDTGNYYTSMCALCPWVSEPYPTRDLVGCRSSWHVYEEHRDAWVAVIGSDCEPVDLDPREIGR